MDQLIAKPKKESCLTRPLIGITTQTLQSIDGIPEVLPHSWVMNSRYYLTAAEMGAVPVMVPLFDGDLDTLRAIYDRLDGLLLAGGVDMEPRTFGEAPHPGLAGPTAPGMTSSFSSRAGQSPKGSRSSDSAGDTRC